MSKYLQKVLEKFGTCKTIVCPNCATSHTNIICTEYSDLVSVAKPCVKCGFNFPKEIEWDEIKPDTDAEKKD